MDRSGRAAIVTGAAPCIGRTVAVVLAEAGTSGIMVADFDEKGAEEIR